MHKKPSALMIIVALAMLVFAATALAEQSSSTDYQATFKIGEAGYAVNNVTTAMDVAAFVENGRTYVPFRYLGYALGVAEQNVAWDAASKSAALTMGGITEKFTVGSTNYTVNNQPKTMDVAPLIRDNRIFLPARYVAQDFGYSVAWDAQTKVVTVTKAAAADPSVSDDVYSVTEDVYGN